MVNKWFTAFVLASPKINDRLAMKACLVPAIARHHQYMAAIPFFDTAVWLINKHI